MSWDNPGPESLKPQISILYSRHRPRGAGILPIQNHIAVLFKRLSILYSRHRPRGAGILPTQNHIAVLFKRLKTYIVITTNDILHTVTEISF
jgi:hypothetical protein